ncbi:MAG: MaoC family dehydratase [Polyangiaceae bacterium]
MPEIRFDDLETLQQQISEEYGDFGSPIHVSQAMIDSFAEITMDPQWIHVDVERAMRESPFGGTIAHGFLVLSLMTALQDGSDLRVVGYGSAINYGAEKLRFVSPVPADSDIHCRRRVQHVRRKGPGTQISYDVEVAVVGAEKPALVVRQLALFLP